VAEVLAGQHVHLSAEEVHGLAGALLPEISRATVYNTLNELVAMGEVLEVSVTNGPKRYDPNAHVAHHHVVCARCQSIRDGPVPRQIEPPGAEDFEGYVVTGIEIVYRGLCPSCAALSAADTDAEAAATSAVSGPAAGAGDTATPGEAASPGEPVYQDGAR
jgi:Fur family transcriptional regulator, stress-responsive regulator